MQILELGRHFSQLLSQERGIHFLGYLGFSGSGIDWKEGGQVQ